MKTNILFFLLILSLAAGCKKEETGFVLTERHFQVEVWSDQVSGSNNPDSNTPDVFELCILVHVPDEDARAEFRSRDYTLEVEADFSYWEDNLGFCLETTGQHIHEFTRSEKRVIRRVETCWGSPWFGYIDHNLK